MPCLAGDLCKSSVKHSQWMSVTRGKAPNLHCSFCPIDVVITYDLQIMKMKTTEQSKNFSCISAPTLWGAAKLPFPSQPLFPSPDPANRKKVCHPDTLTLIPYTPGQLWSWDSQVSNCSAKEVRMTSMNIYLCIIFKKTLIQSFIVFSLWLTPLWSSASRLWRSTSEKHACVDYSHP